MRAFHAFFVLTAGVAAPTAACGGPPPSVVVVSTRSLGATAETPTISGRDGGYSVRAFGRSIWAFGDTILRRPDERGRTWHSNSMAWTDATDAHDGLGPFFEQRDSVGAPADFLLPTQEERAFNDSHHDTDGARWALWPASMVVDAASDRVLVFYLKVFAEPGPFNFAAVGAGIATWSDWASGPMRVRVRPEADESTLLWDVEGPLPVSAVIHGDWAYAFGCDGGTDKGCIVARVDPGRALELDAWSYYDGDDWSRHRGAAQVIMRANDILTVHFNAELDTFIALYSAPLSNEVRYRTAPAPQGPWSDDARAFTAPRAYDGAAPYSAVAHAEFTDGPREFVSYHRGTAPFQSEIVLQEVVFASR